MKVTITNTKPDGVKLNTVQPRTIFSTVKDRESGLCLKTAKGYVVLASSTHYTDGMFPALHPTEIVYPVGKLVGIEVEQ